MLVDPQLENVAHPDANNGGTRLLVLQFRGAVAQEELIDELLGRREGAVRQQEHGNKAGVRGVRGSHALDKLGESTCLKLLLLPALPAILVPRDPPPLPPGLLLLLLAAAHERRNPSPELGRLLLELFVLGQHLCVAIHHVRHLLPLELEELLLHLLEDILFNLAVHPLLVRQGLLQPLYFAHQQHSLPQDVLQDSTYLPF
mmetsp:Transcript_7446/g.21170  ORF Transcript_7446/g.21170 Transcript_7446/m.21170 type:complete len:201 (-) Transcript_7446:176-778(-)